MLCKALMPSKEIVFEITVFSVNPRVDHLFLGAAATVKDCLRLIAGVPSTSEIMLFGHAPLAAVHGHNEMLCFGGPLSQLRDRSVAIGRQRSSAEWPSAWLPDRGAATIACGCRGEHSLETINRSAGPCEGLYASWTCCVPSNTCSAHAVLPENVPGLQVDIVIIEQRLVEAREPRIG